MAAIDNKQTSKQATSNLVRSDPAIKRPRSWRGRDEVGAGRVDRGGEGREHRGGRGENKGQRVHETGGCGKACDRLVQVVAGGAGGAKSRADRQLPLPGLRVALQQRPLRVQPVLIWVIAQPLPPRHLRALQSIQILLRPAHPPACAHAALPSLKAAVSSTCQFFLGLSPSFSIETLKAEARVQQEMAARPRPFAWRVVAASALRSLSGSAVSMCSRAALCWSASAFRVSAFALSACHVVGSPDGHQ